MALLMVRVTARAAKDEAVRFGDGVLHVRVTAPPVDGGANVAVARLLARLLGLAPRDVVLVSGASSRLKRFDVHLTDAELAATIEAALAAQR